MVHEIAYSTIKAPLQVQGYYNETIRDLILTMIFMNASKVAAQETMNEIKRKKKVMNPQNLKKYLTFLETTIVKNEYGIEDMQGSPNPHSPEVSANSQKNIIQIERKRFIQEKLAAENAKATDQAQLRNILKKQTFNKGAKGAKNVIDSAKCKIISSSYSSKSFQLK